MVAYRPPENTLKDEMTNRPNGQKVRCRMNWLNGNKMRLVVVGVVAAMVLGVGSANADFVFGEPKNLGPTVHSGMPGFGPCISADGLELYLESRDQHQGIFVCTRASIDDEWSKPKNLGEHVNVKTPTSGMDGCPSLSADGLELYFHLQSEVVDRADLWVTRRATKSEPWGPAEKLGPPINSTKGESAPSISADGLELYFSFKDPTLPDDDPVQGFYVARRETTDAPWGEPVSLGPVINSWPNQWEPEISSDGLLLMWADYRGYVDPRPGGCGLWDIWYSRRATKDGQWSEPVNLGPPINTAYVQSGPSLSADGSTLYFSSSPSVATMGSTIWQAPILPVVDLNGDGIVDADDMVIIVDNWGTDNSLCDIGPMPWGDGVVDVEDLIVLAEHLFEEFPPAQ